MINLAIMSKEEYEEIFDWSKEEYEEIFDCSLEQPPVKPVKYIICNPSQVENWHNIVVYEDGTIMVFNENGEDHEIYEVSDLIECML